MKSKTLLAVLCSAALCAPARASSSNKPPPKVDGGSVGVDPYVEEFEKAMADANAQLIAIKVAILAVVVPPGTKAGALAAGAKAAGEFAAVSGVVLKAERAHAKFVAHVMGFDPSDDLDIKLNLKGPAFEQPGRKKSAAARPKEDHILKGSFGPAGSAARPAAVARVAAPAQVGGQGFAMVSSPFSYNSSVGPVGAGFESSLKPSAHQAASIDIGQSGAEAGGGVSGGGASTGGPDAPPAQSQSHAQLSQHESDVEKVAEEARQRMLARQRAAEEKARQRREEAERAKEQRQQQMAQMLTQMLGQAAQAMGKTQGSAGEAQGANEGKQQESEQAAAAAPI